MPTGPSVGATNIAIVGGTHNWSYAASVNASPPGSGTVPARMRTLPSWLISRVNARSHKLLVDGFAEAGVRPYHYRILSALQESGPASQAQLGRSTSIDRSDVVVALNELEGLGLVRRAPDPSHGRRNVVTLTPAGARRLIELDKVLDGVQETLLAALTPGERTQFTELLTKITRVEQDGPRT